MIYGRCGSPTETGGFSETGEDWNVMSASPLIAPSRGEPIRMSAQGHLEVPDEPILPFIEGDGTGPDIWRAAQRVLDAAVQSAYAGKKKIAWLEVYAGEKAKRQFDNWLPDETV